MIKVKPSALIKSKIELYLDKMVNPKQHLGYEWYTDVHEMGKEWANNYGIDPMQVYGVLSAFSPMCSWALNQKNAKKFIEGGTVFYLPKQSAKAGHILNLDLQYKNYDLKLKLHEDISLILSGRKTVSFFDNMCYPIHSKKLTVDVHMWDNFKEDTWDSLTPKRYSIMEETFKYISNNLNIALPKLQSSLWVEVRGAYD